MELGVGLSGPVVFSGEGLFLSKALPCLEKLKLSCALLSDALGRRPDSYDLVDLLRRDSTCCNGREKGVCVQGGGLRRGSGQMIVTKLHVHPRILLEISHRAWDCATPTCQIKARDFLINLESTPWILQKKHDSPDIILMLDSVPSVHQLPHIRNAGLRDLQQSCTLPS